MPARKDVTILGIPGSASNPLKVVTESHTITTDCNNDRNRTAATPNFGSGSSGGPWFYRYNKADQFGYLLGIISGCHDGGPNDNTSYSAFWRYDFAKFVNWVADHHE